MIPNPMPALPGPACDRFDAEVRRYIAPVACQPTEVTIPEAASESEVVGQAGYAAERAGWGEAA
jgi:hypothetical protein